MHIAIAGGGIGGLTSALALSRRGQDVELFEQADAFGEVGAGLQLSPNAMRILNALGVGDAVAARACRPVALEMRWGGSGGRIFSIPAGDGMLVKFGAPYLHCHRADLLQALLETAEADPRIRLNLSSQVIEVLNGADELRVGLMDGRVVDADLVVGADGVRSAVRRHVVGSERATFTGCVAWRLTAPAAGLKKHFPEPKATVWVGPGKHAVTYPVRNGELINFVGVVERDGWTKESWTEAGDLAELARDFDGWAEPVEAVIAAAPNCFRSALFDRVPSSGWSRDRAVLLGDAVHPTLPFQAQGAAMGIEDSWALADCLARAEAGEFGVADALARYEARRLPRVRKVVASARSNKAIFHRRSFLARALTYWPMMIADRILPFVIRTRQDWIYGYDETRRR